MDVQIATTAWNEVDSDWLIVGTFEADQLTGRVADFDTILGGKLGRLRKSGDLTGKLAETVTLYDLPEITTKRLLLVGLGKAEELQPARLDKALMTAVRQVSTKKDLRVAMALPNAPGDRLSASQIAQIAAAALEVGCVGQDRYRTEPGRHRFAAATLLLGNDDDKSTVESAVRKGTILGESVNLTRELVDRPAQDVYPESFAERARRVADEFGLTCQILDEQQLRDERMNALLAVAAGSSRPPRVVVLEYRGAGDAAPLGLCGKGVTFDSGGLSLKPSDSMKTMKCDMAGAATVLGAMAAIARLKLPVNVIGFMGLVENMVSGSSYKLGDVLTARNGVTIEVLNTDAEGRLVLADVLSYAVDRNVERLIDLATLTGACLVALGEEVAGVFTNNESWCREVMAAAAHCGEDAWQLPMFDQYTELIKSDVADIKNVGGRWGGAITAAKFLQKFVGDKPWVHLDIAGPAFASSNKPHREGGGTGAMVRTLVEVAGSLSQARLGV